MMRVSHDFDVRCDCCGSIIHFYADEFDYNTYANERNMGEEIEYDFVSERDCYKCGNSIIVHVYGYEYPVGAFNYTSCECEGGTCLQEPFAEMEYEDYEFDPSYEGYVAAECDIINEAIAQKKAEIQAMSDREFEFYVANILTNMGYIAKVTQETRDGGFDIVATKASPIPFTIIVECKHWSNTVGVKVVRELVGVNDAVKANKLILVTSSRFSSEAKTFAEKQKDMMTLWDLDDLIKLTHPGMK